MASAPAAVYAVSGMLFFVSILATTAIGPPERAPIARGVSWESLIAGIRFIRGRPGDPGRDLARPVRRSLRGRHGRCCRFTPGISSISVLSGSASCAARGAVGAVLVGLILAHRSLGRHAGYTMFAGVAIFGAATIVFGLSRSFFVSLVALAILGAADMVSVFVRQNLVQRATPDAMRGRVNAVNFLFVGASNELGEMESGLTASWFGAVGAVVAGGIGTLAVMALWLWRFPALKDVDRLEDIQAP